LKKNDNFFGRKPKSLRNFGGKFGGKGL